ncbi:MAG: lysylphosphatidylglycerol synthetase family protein [Desulfovibrionaceae bacterium]|nr:lysylphosphatidylglycerol synthetase family protein [Desulfovibrionaceae bacterium]
MKKYMRYLGPVLITGIFLLAVYLLYHKLKAYSIVEIRASIQQISYGRITLSLLLMVVNYMILVGYDWLALKAIHKSLPLPRVGLVSFVGQAVSYNFGALLGGTSVRYRFYSAWGFTLADIVRLVLMLAVTFWVGALGLCGLIFLIAPPVIPDELLRNMPITDVRILGVILALIAFAYLALCFVIRKPVHILGKEFVFPAPRIAIAQFVVAGIDLIAAAACMWVLLPNDVGIGFLDFLPSYLMAQVAVVLTHVPGGVGVFELVIIHLSQTTHEQMVFAAVLLFRIIYFIIPLLAAAVLLAIYEARQSKNMLREAGRWLSVLSHSLAAYAAFAGGVILLASAVLPTLPQSMEILSEWLPGWVSGAGHLLCALSGAALLFVSWGLERRQARAFKLALLFLGLGIVGALLKGLCWEVALMVCAVMLGVALARRRFYRSSFFWEEAIPLYWLIGAAAVLGLAIFTGWFIYHPAWEHATSWGFEQHLNAFRAMLALAGIAVGLAASWLWRVALRCRKRKTPQA